MSVTITQGNFGIGIYNTFHDEENKTIKDISNYDCNVDIVYPDSTTENIPIEKIDPANGKVIFILGDKQTSQVGLHRLYFNLIDGNSKITAQNMVSYLVIDDKGGA